MKLVDDILNGMESQEVTAILALDLSAAFDTVNHDLLLVILKSHFGIDGISLACIRSYLDGRSFQVQVGSALSQPIDVPYAVPQGSLLDPVLFICYIASLNDIVQGTSTSILDYADDHAVYKSFLPIDESSALESLTEVIMKIRNWMKHSFLKMNDSKTEIGIFGTNSQCDKITTTTMEVGETPVNISSELNYLGILLDQNSTLKTYILTKRKRAACHLYRIRHIAKFLDLPAKKTFISSLVMSQLDYANAILINLPNKYIHPMQRIQNQAAKVIMNKDRFYSPVSTMRQLHWLPISFRCKYMMLLLVYRCMKDQAPEYLRQKLILRNPVWNTHSATKSNLLHIPYNKRKTLANRGFSSAGPKLWNSLACEL